MQCCGGVATHTSRDRLCALCLVHRILCKSTIGPCWLADESCAWVERSRAPCAPSNPLTCSSSSTLMWPAAEDKRRHHHIPAERAHLPASRSLPSLPSPSLLLSPFRPSVPPLSNALTWIATALVPLLRPEVAQQQSYSREHACVLRRRVNRPSPFTSVFPVASRPSSEASSGRTTWTPAVWWHACREAGKQYTETEQACRRQSEGKDRARTVHTAADAVAKNLRIGFSPSTLLEHPVRKQPQHKGCCETRSEWAAFCFVD